MNQRPELTHDETGMEQAIRFVLWAQSRKQELVWQDVVDVFAVSRSTAFRWLAAWRRANDRG